MIEKHVRKRFLVPVSLVLMFALVLTGCNSQGADGDGLTGSLDILGSNTVTPITTLWAEEFSLTNPGVRISVSGPGSGAGIAALINGTTDICQASRKIKQSEIDQARARGVEPHEIQVAADALSVVVHPTNPVSSLTIEQLSGIYSGKITNWKDVGGNNAPIVAISRDTNSGTHVFFKEVVVQMENLPTHDKSLEYGSRVLMIPSTQEGVEEVAKNANAIFYPGMGYLTDRVKALGIKATAASEAVLPSVETAQDGTYPIARPLLYYTNGQPSGLIKAFVDYCLSAEGQAKVEEAGFVPMK